MGFGRATLSSSQSGLQTIEERVCRCVDWKGYDLGWFVHPTRGYWVSPTLCD